MTGLSLAIDIGGTFTDIVVYDPHTPRHYIYKEYTTPDDPARGVLTGVRALLERDRIAASSITRVVHATTLFTNALIERKGAVTALVTTEGFRDLLRIGRERRYELYMLGLRWEDARRLGINATLTFDFLPLPAGECRTNDAAAPYCP